MDLYSEVKSRLEKLVIESESSGLPISAKPRTGRTCVLTAFEDLEIDINFLAEFQTHNELLKTYSKRSIKSVSDFIRANGGINKTIEVVGKFLPLCRKQRQKLPHYAYTDTLHECLHLMKNTTPRRYLRANEKSSTYCSFCWRRVDMSKYFCEIHHPSQSKKAYYQAKNRLIRAIQLRNPEYYAEYKIINTPNHKRRLPLYYYKWTESFVPNPIKIARQLESVELSKLDYQNTKGKLLDLIRINYPLTYNLFEREKFNETETWQDFIILSLKALDGIESSLWQAKGIDSWMSIISVEPISPDIRVILNVFRRHEATEVINSMQRPRGPKKGADIPSKNKNLREKVIQLVKKQSESGKKINKAAIGRELNLSRERIRVLMKELDL